MRTHRFLFLIAQHTNELVERNQPSLVIIYFFLGNCWVPCLRLRLVKPTPSLHSGDFHLNSQGVSNEDWLVDRRR